MSLVQSLHLLHHVRNADPGRALKKLLEQLLERYAYGSVLAVDSRSKYYSVSRKNMSVGENAFFHNCFLDIFPDSSSL